MDCICTNRKTGATFRIHNCFNKAQLLEDWDISEEFFIIEFVPVFVTVA